MNLETVKGYESALVGAALIHSHIVEEVALKPTHFFDPRASSAWRAILQLQENGRPVDVLTVEGAIKAHLGESDWVVGFLGDSALNVPTPRNAVDYSRQIKAAAKQREAILRLSEGLERAKRCEAAEIEESLAETIQALSETSEDGEDPGIEVAQLAKLRVRELEAMASAKARGEKVLTGIPTGVAMLDSLVGGWPLKIASIVAARPGMGKSSLGLATARACESAGVGCHVFSLEDAGHAYADRNIAQESGVSAEVLRSLNYTQATMQSLAGALPKLFARKRWLFDESTGLTADDVVRRVRRRARENQTKLVVVDYIQLLRWPKGVTSSHEALGRSITAFADAAKTDGMAYVIMSQLNRGLETRTDKRPQLSDLRESGSLEERAKLVVGVYRGSKYGDPVSGVDYEDGECEPEPSDWAARCDLLVLKNSNGQTGCVRAKWDGPSTRIW